MGPDWISVILGAASVVFALYEWRKRVKLEKVVRDTLSRLAGDVRVTSSNARWADQHIRSIAKSLAEVQPDLPEIRKRAIDCARDATACVRQLSLIHSHVRGIQQSLSDDSKDTIPEIQSDDVKRAFTEINQETNATGA
jgi:hypothetical protein